MNSNFRPSLLIVIYPIVTHIIIKEFDALRFGFLGPCCPAPGTAAFATPTVARVAARDGFAAAAARREPDSSRAEARHASAGEWRAEL